jgi:prephenate dehydratase
MRKVYEKPRRKNSGVQELQEFRIQELRLRSCRSRPSRVVNYSAAFAIDLGRMLFSKAAEGS